MFTKDTLTRQQAPKVPVGPFCEIKDVPAPCPISPLKCFDCYLGRKSLEANPETLPALGTGSFLQGPWRSPLRPWASPFFPA